MDQIDELHVADDFHTCQYHLICFTLLPFFSACPSRRAPQWKDVTTWDYQTLSLTVQIDKVSYGLTAATRK
jgi:hypothetical protein